jgi:hypothetical protein
VKNCVVVSVSPPAPKAGLSLTVIILLWHTIALAHTFNTLKLVGIVLLLAIPSLHFTNNLGESITLSGPVHRVGGLNVAALYHYVIMW